MWVKISRLAFLLFLIYCLVFLPVTPLRLAVGAEKSTPLGLFVNPPRAVPYLAGGKEAPPVSAKSGLILEPVSHSVLWSKNPRAKLPIASLTKIMAALVLLENVPLEEEVVFNLAEDGSSVELGSPAELDSRDQLGSRAQLGSQMGLESGEKVTVETLLLGMLLNSGNDATEALSEIFPGGKDNLVIQMNDKAKVLNLDQTRFTNPVGWHDPEHFSSATDLANLARYVLNNSFLAQVVSTETKVVTSLPYVDSTLNRLITRWHYLRNTHPLLGEVSGVKGVKTGYTQEAGECLVTYVERGNRQVIVVVLGSKDRRQETKDLIDWVYVNWKW